MLSIQCLAKMNLVPTSQLRFLSRVRCLSKEQQTCNKSCGFRVNAEAIRSITTTVRWKPVELIKKGDTMLKNVYVGSYFSPDKYIHVSPTSFQRNMQDDEKRKNYIFMGVITFMVVGYVILSFSIEEHADHVKVK